MVRFFRKLVTLTRDPVARREWYESWIDFNNYSRKKLVAFFLLSQLGGGLYYTLKNTLVDDIPLYHVDSYH